MLALEAIGHAKRIGVLLDEKSNRILPYVFTSADRAQVFLDACQAIKIDLHRYLPTEELERLVAIFDYGMNGPDIAVHAEPA